MPIKKVQTSISNSGQQRAIRIEVCGGIASGKTTLAKLLGRVGIDMVLENFQANPFLALFYSDTRRFAFETEITFLLQHYSQIKVEDRRCRTFICDFSLYLDIAYAAVTLQGTKYKAFQTIYDEVKHELDSPDLLVYLNCGASTELQRIRSRNRTVEQSLDVEFLNDLNVSLKQHVDLVRETARVVEINSEQVNFATDWLVQEDVVNLILDSLRSPHTAGKNL